MANLSWQVGDVKITRVVEIESAGNIIGSILPKARGEAVRRIKWLMPHFAEPDGKLKGSIQAFIVETPARRIMVDTCIGNDKPRPVPAWDKMQTTFLTELEAANYARESFDTVLCTHMHVDHVGWNTMLVDGKWLPTFPQARYLVAKTEYNHWIDDKDDMQSAVNSDSVMPIMEAGLMDLVPTSHKVCDEITLYPTHGHTPGHVSIRIESKGEEALITGDCVHHPIQMAHIDWSSTFDSDPEAAAATRRDLFAKFADTPTLIIGTHFSGVTAGKIVKDGDAYRLDI